jgi:hypothetical protein
MEVSFLLDVLSSRFGLKPRRDWEHCLRQGIAEESDSLGLAEDEILRQARLSDSHTASEEPSAAVEFLRRKIE